MGNPPNDPDGSSSGSSSSSDKPKRYDRKTTPWDEDTSDGLNNTSSDEDDRSDDSSDSWPKFGLNSKEISKAKRRKLRRKMVKKLRAESANDERRQQWACTIHRTYINQIRHHVGQPLPTIDGIKNVKVPTPELYGGEPDVEAFEAWLLSLLRWLVINRYCGPDFDHLRVQLAGTFLKDKAIRWYNDEVVGAHRIKTKWNFEEVIISLFDRCVQAATVHQATKRFEEVLYTPDKGVKDYYSNLTRWASRMPQPPNAYSFRKRFLNGLPNEIIGKMIERGAVPEYASIRTMVKTVQRIEDNRVLQNFYVRNQKPSDPKDSKYYVRRIRRERNEGPKQRDGKPISLEGKLYRIVRKNKQNPKLTEESNKRFTPRTNDKGKARANPPAQTTQKLCYACGKPGHFANDPTCERYGKPRLYAVQEESESQQEESNDPPEDKDIPQLQEVVDSDDESEGEWALEPYEDNYVGQMYEDEDEEMTKFFSKIHENEKPTTEDSAVGFPVCIEDDWDIDTFPRINPMNHEFQIENEQMFTIDKEQSTESTPKGVMMLKSSRNIMRPDRGPIKERKPLTAIINIGGTEAFTLFDSGCTIKVLNPNFVRVARIKIHQLAQQHSLQLGTVGSKAKFNYGTTTNIQYDNIKDKLYFDIVNIDRYDAIVGTHFMRKHGIQLNFDNNKILIKGKAAPTLSVGEDAAEFSRRMAMRREKLNAEFRRKDQANTRETKHENIEKANQLKTNS